MNNGVPKGRLQDLADFTMGQSPNSSNVNSDENGLPFLQGCAEFGSRYPSAKVHCSPPLRVAKAGSTLISVRAPVGTMNRADQDYCIGRGLAAIRAKAGMADNLYLQNAIKQNVAFLHRRSQGSTFLAVGSDDLKSLPVPAPELPVQRRIAEILSTVDDAIEQTESLIAKTQQIKAGLMHDLFTRGVTPDGQLRPPREEAPQLYKDSPLGRIPREWDVRSWGAVTGSWAMGPRFPGAAYSESGNFATLRTTDMDAEGVIEYATMPLAQLDPSTFHAHVLHPLDFVISRSGSCGIAAVFEGHELPVLPGAFLIRYRFSEEINPQFLRFYVNAPVGARYIARVAEGGVQKNLRGSELCRIPLPVPQRVEQDSIVELIESAYDRIRRESDLRKNLRAVKRGLMTDLLEGIVDVIGPSYTA